jgi:hypothetical protein
MGPVPIHQFTLSPLLRIGRNRPTENDSHYQQALLQMILNKLTENDSHYQQALLQMILNSNNLWKTLVENDSHYQSQACGKPVEKPVENGSLSNTITRIF